MRKCGIDGHLKIDEVNQCRFAKRQPCRRRLVHVKVQMSYLDHSGLGGTEGITPSLNAPFSWANL